MVRSGGLPSSTRGHALKKLRFGANKNMKAASSGLAHSNLPQLPSARTARNLSGSTARSNSHLDSSSESQSEPLKDAPQAFTSKPRAPQPEFQVPYADSNDPAHAQTLQKLLRHPTLFNPIRKPRHPLVLAHGLFGFDTFGLPYLPRFQYAYWHDVLKILKDVIGAEVIVTNVPGAGDVKTRAEALHRYLNQHASSRAVNILAHSMGGLDARHLLTHLQPTSYTPLSLTTLSTPHRGSDFMSWCGANIGVGERMLASEMAAKKKSTLPYSLRNPLLSATAAASSSPEKAAAQKKEWSSVLASFGPAFNSYLLKLLDSPAYSNLTPEFLDEFNELTPDVDSVRYFSVSARVTRIGVWHPLWLPKVILDAADEQRVREHGGRRSLGNDCLVPVESALWGEHIGIVDNCDHWDLRGSAGLRTSAAHSVQNAVSESDLEEREKHREKLRRVYQSISDFRSGAASDNSNKKPTGGSAGLAKWISARIPFVDGGDTRKTSQSKKAPSQTSQRDPNDQLSFTTSSTPKPGTFTLEALYISLARKLYDEGF